MIISHKNKYIFFHCRKAAGTSLSVSLYRNLGCRDIATGSWSEAKSEGISYNFRMRLWAAGSAGNPEEASAEIKRRFLRVAPGSGAAHATASQIKSAFPRVFADYFKFCVVRNPYQRVVSDYKWRVHKWRTQNKTSTPSFGEFLYALASGDNLNGFCPVTADNWEIYSIDGKPQMDRFIRFESLHDDLRGILADDLDLKWDGWLPQHKISSSQRDRGLKVIPSEKELSLIGKIFEREISHFNYGPPKDWACSERR